MAAIPAGAGSLLGKRLGKYEVVALLALGGTAEIYLARIEGTSGFEKYVVVKCLHDHLADDIEFVKMFLDEARLAAHLDHSNIVQTFELGEYENRYYMVMEFLAGLSLAMIVRRASERLPGGRMPVPLVLNIVAQACGGLHYAHEKAHNGKPLHIVHRDISPQNLVVSFEGVVKVVDFGIAKADARETRTRSGTIKGKFAYMSPEQCVANDVDRRTDVFALGVIAHELLTGRRLFKRPSPYETYQAVIECKVEPPSAVNHELDPALDDVIMRAIAKTKAERYVNAEAFGDALQSYLHHRGKGSGPGDVGRFLDTAFAQEIDEHGQRMRELIEGRVVNPGGWDEEDEDNRKKAQRADAAAELRGGEAAGGGQQSGGLLDRSSEHEADERRDTGEDDVDEDEPTRQPDGDDELPADRTRIESNPLERLSPSDLAMSAPPPEQASQAAQAAQAAAASAAARPKFPFAASLPTTISQPDADDAADLASTSIGKEPLNDARLAAIRGGRAVEQPPFVPAGANANGRGSRPLPGVAQNGAPRTSPPAPPMPSTPAAPAAKPGSAPRAAVAAPADRELLTRFPAPAVASPAAGSQTPNPQDFQGMQAMHGGAAPDRASHDRPANVYDTIAHVDPSHGGYMPSGDPGPYGQPGPHGHPGHPGHAAQVASPVGEGYPPADWGDAAAMPVRIVPPWMLAILFVVALGVALGLTFAIAQLIR